jgi:hypothetical protein
MKKLIITIALLIVAIAAFSQATRIQSVQGDFIWIQPGARQCVPMIVSGGNDTARSIVYRLTVMRDTTTNSPLEIMFYDRNGGYLNSTYQIYPDGNFNKWTQLITKLDVFINKKRIVLQ